ncbi:peptidoglycan-binding protein [Brevibacterium litoralis]|uniref:peptidoglycan-binding protein n=1 Tax=Brevibacterium litoralis TaxID=3138935 RepID=UPI0032EC450A
MTGRTGTTLATTVVLVMLACMVAWVAHLVGPGGERTEGERRGTPGPSALTDAQVENARTIIAIGKGEGMSDEAIVIALMTAGQESSFRNLDHGDRDSLGLFQQRPSKGWGTTAQVRDPVWATTSFLGTNPDGENPGLIQIDGWERMRPTEAAQAVQRSAYPEAYAKWEPLAKELLDAHRDVDPIG